MSWFLFHFTITHGTISKRRLILFQFFLLLLSFLNFFFFFSFAISKSVGNPTHTRRWMTHGPCSEVKRALCSLPSQRFIASPLLFDRKLSTTSIWTSNSHSSFGKRRAFLFFLFLFLSPRQRIYIYIETIYSLDKMQVSFERIPQRTGAIGLKETEVGRERTPSVIIANGGNSIGESLSIGCFLTTTLSTPTPQLLVFQTTGMGSSTTKILRSGVLRFRVSANLWNEKRKKKRYFEE